MSTIFKGTSGANTHSGNETFIYGYAGDDSLTATGTSGAGSIVYAGDGNDTLTGGGANNVFYGGSGDDHINAGAGNDSSYGGLGNDIITTGDGRDFAAGGAGDDSITGGSGNQILDGGAGNDTLTVGIDATTTNLHTLTGDDGADTLSALGSSSLNHLYGGAGNDIITGSASGHDSMRGGADTNTITGNATNHANETVSYMGTAVLATAAGVTANLTTGIADETWVTGTHPVSHTLHDTIAIGTVDNLIGSFGKDTLTGNTAANSILGSFGADTIDGGGSSISANVGNDTLMGGYGNDTFVIHNGSQTAESIDGGIGVDTVDFSNVNANASITSASLPTPPVNNSVALYTQGTVTGVYANLSQDISSGVNFKGAAGTGHMTSVEKLIGTAGADYVVSFGGDYIDAGAGNDTILGSHGGASVDVIKGGAGNNVYDGMFPTFADRFGVGNATGEVDTIYGFSNGIAGQDKLYIDISDYTAAGHALTAGSYTAATSTVAASLNASQVINNTTGLAAASNTNSQFIFRYDAANPNAATNGNLYFDADGSGAGAAAVQIAHIDVATYTSAHSVAMTIDKTDFILVA